MSMNETVAQVAVDHGMLHTTNNLSLQDCTNRRSDEMQTDQSRTQEWFFKANLQGHSTQHVIVSALQLGGLLDFDALTSALETLHCRHVSLRSSFAYESNRYLQRSRCITPDVATVQLRTNSIAEALKEESATPFDLEAGPAWRARIFALQDDSHVLSLTFHQIIVDDDEAVPLLWRDLAHLYTEETQGRGVTSIYDSPQIHSISTTTLHGQTWRSEQTGQHLDYWKRQLSGGKAACLPYDFDPSKVSSKTTHDCSAQLKADVRERLISFSESRQVAVSTVLLAGFWAALHRLTGSIDSFLGFDNASRRVDGLDVGSSRTRHVRLQHDEGTFDDLVRHAQEQVTEGTRHDEVPADMVMSHLRPGQGPSQNDIARTLFAMHPLGTPSSKGSLSFGRLTTSAIKLSSPSQFDLELHCYQDEQGFNFEAHYVPELYCQQTIQNLLSVLIDTIDVLLVFPTEQVSAFPFTIQGHDKTGLSVHSEYPRDSSIVDAFRQQVALFPEHVAVKDASSQYTYKELDRLSTTISQWLLQRDLPAETLIGVYAGRSCETISMMMGILKANMAYVPLDVRTPTVRLSTMLKSMPALRLVLMAADMSRPDLETDQVEFLYASQAQALVNSSENTSVGRSPGPRSLAYVMFTSGSSGVPKGVMIEHGGVVNLVKESNLIATLPPQPIIAHVLNIAFDPTTWDIYAALLNGGTIVCIDYLTTLDSKLMFESLESEAINNIVLTASLFKQYIQEDPKLLSTIDTIIVGGERIDPQDLAAFRGCMKGVFVNAYGPTETTFISTLFPVEKHDRRDYWSNVPIGHALSNSGAHVVDEHMRPVPAGVIGELLLTGDGLARGYTDASKDADAFIHVTLGGVEMRCYRTGDRVRCRPSDDEVEFLGRLDGQVKVRGHRVEPREIERVLLDHEDVNDAVVLPQKSSQGTEVAAFVSILQSPEPELSLDEPLDHADYVHMREDAIDADIYKAIDDLSVDEIGRDFVGWTSMYDGSNIAREDMNEWLDDTIQTIVESTHVRHVIEVGCGSGMILFNLPETLETYIGLDPSPRAVAFVSRAANSTPRLSGKVEIRRRTATSIGSIQQTSPGTTLIVNSVAQYFPSQRYLTTLIETVLESLTTVETMFFGDVRSKGLHDQFLAAMALHRCLSDASKAAVRRMMSSLADNELEFLIEPAFFTRLIDLFPDKVAHVEIIPKRVRATNELSSFRYAAVVHINRPGSRALCIRSLPASGWTDFDDKYVTETSLINELKQTPSDSVVAIANIPFRKTILERSIMQSLQDPSPSTPDSSSWLADLKDQTSKSTATSPFELFQIAQEAGFKVEISWARHQSQQGGFDAIFHRLKASGQQRVLFEFPFEHQGRTPQSLTSHPWLQQKKQSVRDALYQSMRNRLPPYMVPRSVTFLDRLPVNENGKVDKRALLDMSPQIPFVASKDGVREATTPTQMTMQRVWSKILGIDAYLIGLDDNFFGLGGTSITAMKVASEARVEGLTISVTDIFRNPSLEHVASAAATLTTDDKVIEPFSLLPESKTFLQDISTRYDIPLETIEDAYPCTPLQAGLMSLTLKRPGDYISQSRIQIPSKLSVDSVQHAFKEVAQQFSILRTRIVPTQHGLVQLVVKQDIAWETHDDLQVYLEMDRRLSMDFGKPLARYAIVEESPASQPRLVWTIHHALFDAWSMSLIVDALNRTLKSQAISLGPSLPSLLQYMSQIDDEAGDNFWRGYLEGSVDSVAFPAIPSSVAEPVTDRVIEYQVDGLRLNGLQTPITSVVRGAWALVVSQMTGSTGILFGSTLSGRSAPIANIERMAAPAFTTVPIRVRTAREQSVQSYLETIHADSTEMIPFEQFGLPRIAKCSQAPCDFQTLLLIQAEDQIPAASPSSETDVAFEWDPYKTGQQQYFNPYALMLEVFIQSGGLLVKASFDSKIIDPEIMPSILSRLESAMRQLTTVGSSQNLSNITMLPAEDLLQLWQWSKDLPPSIDRCLHDLISDHVRNKPEAPAVAAWDGDLSYAKLDTLSNAVAIRMTEAGVFPGQVLPLCFEKSMWTPVAMLGVLKAGAAFVLLDSSLPEQRLRNIVKQLDTKVVVCSSSQAALSSRLNENIIVIHSETTALQDQHNRVSFFSAVQSPSTTAFVVFTSGSTGVPKGVVVSHANFASSVTYQSTMLGFDGDSRVFDFAAYSFDIAVHNFAAALTNGGCLCIPHEDQRKNNAAEAMASMNVTIADLTPSVARLVDPDSVPTLKTLILAGEAVSRADCQQWKNSSTHVINAYGPAECTISTINAGSNAPEGLKSIGRGCGIATWIVDPNDHDTLLPVGCVGELLLEGPLIAQAYLGDEVKTSASFIHDPPWLLRGVPGSIRGRRGRIYKTSDLAQYNADGSISFLGRKDTQVKIRGQRVELGEIEHCLSLLLPEANRIVVEVVQGSGRDGKALLCAIFEQNKTSAIDQETERNDGLQHFNVSNLVKEQLTLTLPRYMLPDAYIRTDALPETSTGKIDRRRVREMAGQIAFDISSPGQVDSSRKRQPRNAMESEIRDLWASVLGIKETESIGIDDSFFVLGGNSIDAMRLVGEARKASVHLSMADIFRHPVLHQLAKQKRQSDQTTQIPRLSHSGPTQQSFAQGRLWFIEHLHSGMNWYLMPLAVRLNGHLSLPALEQAFSALQLRHESLRTIFASNEAGDVQIVQSLEGSPLQVVDLADTKLLDEALDRERATPFDLLQQPGFKARLFRLAEDEHVLSIVLHHIICDGWSLEILRRELSDFYASALQGTTLSDMLEGADEMPIQYRDYTMWQRDTRQRPVFAKQLEYWAHQLEPSRAAEFMCDKPRPEVLSGKASSQTFQIGGALYDDLQRLCKSTDVTPFTILLAAFRAAHFRMTNSGDAIIGCPNANRDLWEVKNVIGFFVNLQAIRLLVEDDTSFLDLIRQTHSTVSESLANQDVPFEEIVSRLNKERDLSRNQLAQTAFVLHTQRDIGEFHLHSIETEQITVARTSRFDLELHVFQESDKFRGELIYSQDLFLADTARAIISVFESILKAGVATPETSIGLLPLDEPSQDTAMLTPPRSPSIDTTYPRDSSIVDVFLDQVAQTPERVAVVDQEEELTYAQLDSQSDTVASWLRRQLLAPETLVGVYADRSCENIVAILGILKANLAYLPFDTRTPPARIEIILETIDSRKLVLVGSSLQAPQLSLCDVDFIPITNLTKEQTEMQNIIHQDLAPVPVPCATSLAYAMYTSGTTGTPKGVLIEHRGVVRLSKNSNLVSYHPHHAVVSHMSNLGFDASTWEIYSCLLNGGTLVCVNRSQVFDHSQLEHCFITRGIQAAILTPPLLQEYLTLCPTLLAQLEVLVVGGDVLEPRTLRAARKVIRGPIINAYGPTENTVASTIYEVPDTEFCLYGVPIGLPLSNSNGYVMDENQELVPKGVMGELVVTGDGLARGYTDSSRNQAFVWIEVCGVQVRAYRTGDRVRVRPSDGQLEVFGRIDRQVKIMGNRLELAEVEHVLASHSSVDNAAVVLSERGSGPKAALLAFVVLSQQAQASQIHSYEAETINVDEGVEQVRDGEDLLDTDTNSGIASSIGQVTLEQDSGGCVSMYHGSNAPSNMPDDSGRTLFRFASDHDGRRLRSISNEPLKEKTHQKITLQLRELLESRLPSYMIPRSISILDKMPINANGKLDRQALAGLSQTRSHRPPQSREIRHPTSQVQETMRRVWAGVLGREGASISIDDNFFLQGGDSILAMRLVSQARSAGLHVSVADIFKHPTLESLAEHCKNIAVDIPVSEEIKPFGVLPSTIDVEALKSSLAAEYNLEQRSIQDVYPCTPLQEGLVSLTSKRAGDYVMQEVVGLSNKVSLAQFRNAWEQVYEAFPILRTTIVKDDRLGLLQVVLDSKIDWALAPVDSFEMQLGHSLVNFALQFDDATQRHHFTWTMHHAAYDGWSFGLILNAFNEAYHGKLLAADESFPRFVQHIQEQDKQAANSFWRQTLDGCEAAPFPQVPIHVEQPVSNRIFTYPFECGQHTRSGVTTSLRLRAAWALVAGQVDDTRDVVFGSTQSGRNVPIPGIEDMAAPAFATIPVRVQWTEEMSISDYLQMIQQDATETMPFEQTGLHQIASLSPVCEQACRFQTLLVISSQGKSPFDSDSASLLELKENDSQQQRRFNPYALMLEIQLEDNKVSVKASFDSRCISEDLVIRLLERLGHVMHQFDTTTPDETLGDIQKLTTRDLNTIREWNKHCPDQIDKCVHDLIEQRVDVQPDALAIHAWDRDLTYSQLDQYANGLAGQLISTGIGSGDLIPICFEKSAWTSVAVLGVMKAGAGFVLLDCSLPRKRLQSIVDQTKCKLVLSSVANKELASAISPTSLVLEPSNVASTARARNPSLKSVSPSSTLCTVFTSGSTGQPKGVMLTHSNFVSGLHHQLDRLRGFTAKSRVFDFASYAFDIAIHNVLATLITGGTLCVPSDEQRLGSIQETMAAMRVTTADLTPSVARLIIPDSVPTLNTLIFAGEALSASDVKSWIDRERPIQLVNAYGPAECGISTINFDDSSPERLTSIGKGAGVVTWVVDAQDPQKLVGPGCVGELLLEGPLVGAGYLGNPTKTQDSFIESPLWLTAGSNRIPGRQNTLYKTGDLVRYDESGRLIFLGRKDSQLKIRGQRVELEEIQSGVQQSLPAADQVAIEVISDEKGASSNQLVVAFVVMKDADTSQHYPSVLEISAGMQDSLHKRLPRYMVPSMFVQMQEIPMTATRKADRRKLQEIGHACLATVSEARKLSGAVLQDDNDQIPKSEQPAFDLAVKILALSPGWNRSSPQILDDNSYHRPGSIKDMRLHACGLDSVAMMSLKHHVLRKYGVSVEMQLLLNRSITVRSLAARIQAGDREEADSDVSNPSSGPLNLMNEILKTEKAIQKDTQHLVDLTQQAKNGCDGTMSKASNSAMTVFLTGASGFIGTQILRHLLKDNRVDKVFALVRAKTSEAALQRTIDAAQRARWWNDEYLKRLTVWKGDLSQSRLGLEQKQWVFLTRGENIDAIIHNGAVVHWGKSYADLEVANVKATATLLSIASAQSEMRLIHVTGGQGQIYKAGAEGTIAQALSEEGVIGYAQSKFVAEALVRRAARGDHLLGRRIAVMSPALVVGTQEEGVANADDYLWRLVAACVNLGGYDADQADEWLNVSDVATVAANIVSMALKLTATQEEEEEVTPIRGRMTWAQFWAVFHGMGYELEAMSNKDWLSKVKQDVERGREAHPLWPIMHMIQGEGEPKHGDESSGNVDSWAFDDKESEEGMAKLQQAIIKSAQFLASTGFLSNPGTSKTRRQDDGDSERPVAFKRSGL